MSDYVTGRIPVIKNRIADCIFTANEIKSIGIREHNNPYIKDKCNGLIETLKRILKEIEKL